jgi:phage shock protein E
MDLRRLVSLLPLALALVAGGVVLAQKGDFIPSEEAHALVKKGARLVDVRTPEEFAAGHVEGAVNIPVHELDKRLAELEPKDKPVVVYCKSGRRSAKAKDLLQKAGFTSVHNLGGMDRW